MNQNSVRALKMISRFYVKHSRALRGPVLRLTSTYPGALAASRVAVKTSRLGPFLAAWSKVSGELRLSL